MKKNLSKTAEKYLAEREAGKRAYERAENLMGELAKAVGHEGEIALKDGRKLVIVDRFEGKDLVWTPCAARRWDAKVAEA